MRWSLALVAFAALVVSAAAVSVVNLHKATNMAEHHTDAAIPHLGGNVMALRRAQSFLLTINRFSLNYRQLAFELYHPASTVPLKLSWPSDHNNYSKVKLDIPVTAEFRRYQLRVRANSRTYNLGVKVIVLFNPWSAADKVVFKSGDATARDLFLRQYLLENTGNIQSGSHSFWWEDSENNGGMSWIPWQFNTFEVLEILVDFADKNFGDVDRADPLAVAYSFTYYLRSPGDCADWNKPSTYLLVACWTSSYYEQVDRATGAQSFSWSNSRDIYRKWRYGLTNRRPHNRPFQAVPFAQCFIFGGALTTALRGVGIASRPITTYSSAVDENHDRIIDKNVGESIWNFHVWNDAWFNRGTHEGWNAVDATYSTGPAIVDNIKNNKDQGKDGEWDVGHYISETNSAVWKGTRPYNANNAAHNYRLKVNRDNPLKFDNKEVGSEIATSKFNCHHLPYPPPSTAVLREWLRKYRELRTLTDAEVAHYRIWSHKETLRCMESITNQYKASDFPFADSYFRFARKTEQKFPFRTETEPTTPAIGDNFVVRIKQHDLVLNTEQPVDIKLEVLAIMYNGNVTGAPFKTHTAKAKLSPSGKGNVLAEHNVTAEDYLNFMSQTSFIRARFVIEGGDIATTEVFEFRLSAPPVSVNLKQDAQTASTVTPPVDLKKEQKEADANKEKVKEIENKVAQAQVQSMSSGGSSSGSGSGSGSVSNSDQSLMEIEAIRMMGPHELHANRAAYLKLMRHLYPTFEFLESGMVMVEKKRQFGVVITFVNPLKKKALTKVVFAVSTPENDTKIDIGTIEPGQKKEHILQVSVQNVAGNQNVVVVVTCEQLEPARGSLELHVKREEPTEEKILNMVSESSESVSQSLHQSSHLLQQNSV